MNTTHKFEVGQTVWSKAGKRYTVKHLSYPHQFDGKPGYGVRGERDGKPFGPIRMMAETSFNTET